jgi:hypothetical protein
VELLDPLCDERKEQPILQLAARPYPIVRHQRQHPRRGLRGCRCRTPRPAPTPAQTAACVKVFNSSSREVAPFSEDLDAVDRTVQHDVLGRNFGGEITVAWVKPGCGPRSYQAKNSSSPFSLSGRRRYPVPGVSSAANGSLRNDN